MVRQDIDIGPQSYPRRHDAPSPPPVPPSPPQRGGVFRWEIVLVLLAILAAAWLIRHIPGPTFSWNDVTETLHVSRRGEGRFTQTAVLGLILIAIVHVVKVWRTKR